ncbi:hypothetical protein RMSM_05990 [Rhodopirellula maiorica SM1]|uniref:Uncharacterized protein n=1 Tax=Rhodopirellula maiorica SM1 TaxID=1265738 RepID=M5RDC2_9BACT|nr:hypothetical protein RMSM_05990 [Rhodopirellula maiorica SM1]
METIRAPNATKVDPAIDAAVTFGQVGGDGNDKVAASESLVWLTRVLV